MSTPICPALLAARMTAFPKAHPDDVPVETPEESARIIAERHRASVRALWGGR